MNGLQCRVQARIEDSKRGPWALPSWEDLWVGRAAGSGLYFGEEWIPRQLCRFVPVELGWLVHNGPRTRMRVQNRYVEDTCFEPHALVALQGGNSLLSWPELDDTCQLGVVIGDGVAGDLKVLRNGREAGGSEARTAYAADRLEINPALREAMAVMFAHLISGERRPDNLAAAAGRRLGRSEQAMTNSARKLRERINEERWLNLETLDQLGHYLVVTTHTLTSENLPRQG